MTRRQMANLIYHLTMVRSRYVMTRSPGREFWRAFRHLSDEQFARLMTEFEDIGGRLRCCAL